jgi:ATP-dependent exoDNAse (exonuclease V) alpha subunit
MASAATTCCQLKWVEIRHERCVLSVMLDITERKQTESQLLAAVQSVMQDTSWLSLAYATTIHKSQGSEYPAVVIPLTTQHYTMLARNLPYTGVTRGKRLVVLVGQRKALAIAVRNEGARRRWSKLRDWLDAADAHSP